MIIKRKDAHIKNEEMEERKRSWHETGQELQQLTLFGFRILK